MIFKIFQEKPDYLIIARDAPTKTIRHDIFPEYKANRKKMDDDFKSQIPITKQIVQEL
jgi:DNA polymerase-1